jgi:hypothetical protein
MVEDKLEEETYSLIFTSLKHSIRRRILRMLADKPSTYSEILETLNIDSGHLSYHLENLGDLIVHSKDGQYKLSSFGAAAVKLMGGVEEQTPASSNRRIKPRGLLAKVYPIILAFALIAASFHLVTYSSLVFTTTSSTASLVPPVYSNIPFKLSTDETFEIMAYIEYSPVPSNHGTGLRGNFDEWTFTIPRLESTLTGWDEATIWIDSRFNLKTPDAPQQIKIIVGNETILENRTVIITIEGNSGFAVIQNSATDPSNLEVAIAAPEGATIQDNFFQSGGTASSPLVPITQEGLYKFMITNKDICDWNGFLTVNVQLQHYEKPYFYWGVVGFIIALGYIGLVTAARYKTRNKT